MRSENKNETMRLQRLMAHPLGALCLLIIIDAFYFFLFNYVINSLANLPALIRDVEHPDLYIGFSNLLPEIASAGEFVRGLYFVGLIVLIFGDVWLLYKIRVAFAEGDINKGQSGTSRWTTRKELHQQFKKVPLRDGFYPGKGGVVISRWRDTLFIENVERNRANNLMVGTTRSGKDEMYVTSTMDVLSRAEFLTNRPSMIINDPKVEQYKICKKVLEERGYIVRLLNLDDPTYSMKYNPLQLTINHYKTGRIERAQMAARTYAFSIFHADENKQEAIWKNTATDLFTALIISVTSDCLAADQKLEEELKIMFKQKQENFLDMDEKLRDILREEYIRAKNESVENEYIKLVEYIPDEETFQFIPDNEKKVNSFSCINFFKELCNRAAKESADDEDFEKKAETALDDYFNARPKLDYAASLYSSIQSSGDKTQGSVFINMQSALSTFSLSNVAKMTAENDIYIEDIGYGDKPIAIFMGIPAEDRSMYFLATTFVVQVTQYLFQLSKNTKGKLKREVKFILNEFGNMPSIENFSGFVTVGLGIGISMDIYVQALNQIHAQYGEDEDTIKENFANQIYIKSVGNESSKEFSELLGNKTTVKLERSGERNSLKKNYIENPSEQPLMFPSDLNVLKMGESVVHRPMARMDILGTGVASHPIINEYLDKLPINVAIKGLLEVFLKRIIKKEVLFISSEQRNATFLEEFKVKRNYLKQYLGTALLLRYQYMGDVFPNPDTVDFFAICDESTDDVDWEKRTYDPGIVLKALKGDCENPKKTRPQTLSNHPKAGKIKNKLIDILGEDCLESINMETKIDDIIRLLKDNDIKDGALLTMLAKGGK